MPPARPRWRCTAQPRPRRRAGVCAFVDAERALDIRSPQAQGQCGRPPDLAARHRRALENVPTWRARRRDRRAGGANFVCRARCPRAELEGGVEETSAPRQPARLMSGAAQKLSRLDQPLDAMVIFINQIRLKIGVMYSSPQRPPPRTRVEILCLGRLDIRRIGAIKERDEVVGDRPRQGGEEQAPPRHFSSRVRHHVRRGRLQDGELIDLGVIVGVVDVGAWFSYDSQRRARAATSRHCLEQSNITGEVEAAVAECRPDRREGCPAQQGKRRGRGRRQHALSFQLLLSCAPAPRPWSRPFFPCGRGQPQRFQRYGMGKRQRYCTYPTPHPISHHTENGGYPKGRRPQSLRPRLRTRRHRAFAAAPAGSRWQWLCTP